MAESQLVCLDDEHVNVKVAESRPEFYYSEEQRAALEQLLRNGDGAFKMRLKQDSVKDFLCARELRWIRDTFREYDKENSDHKSDNAVNNNTDEAENSTYWPSASDAAVPQLDLGWTNEGGFYRGVTRVSVYTHPPKDNSPHIRAVVRKLIQEASKVVAVVMDLLTDLLILQDLLDAASKRNVAVYLLLEESGLPHFLDMCTRLQISAQHLRVCCWASLDSLGATGQLKGSEILVERYDQHKVLVSSLVYASHTAGYSGKLPYIPLIPTILSLKVRVRTLGGWGLALSLGKLPGSLSSKYMLVDGDKVLFGSYSFTWTSSRLNRNTVTLMSGQVVEFFDNDFRELYAGSDAVDLYQEFHITKPPIPQNPAPVPPNPAPVTQVPPPPVSRSRFQVSLGDAEHANLKVPAHKYHNPKYALVVGNSLGITGSLQDLTKLHHYVGQNSESYMEKLLRTNGGANEPPQTLAQPGPDPSPNPSDVSEETKRTPKNLPRFGSKKQRSSFRLFLKGRSPNQSPDLGATNKSSDSKAANSGWTEAANIDSVKISDHDSPKNIHCNSPENLSRSSPKNAKHGSSKNVTHNKDGKLTNHIKEPASNHVTKSKVEDVSISESAAPVREASESGSMAELDDSFVIIEKPNLLKFKSKKLASKLGPRSVSLQTIDTGEDDGLRVRRRSQKKNCIQS